MSNNDIVINLNSSHHNQPVNSSTELIQHEAFDTLRQQILKDLVQAKSKTPTKDVKNNVDNDLYPNGSGLTYFIDGTRGAGKSTFLGYTYANVNEKLADAKNGNTVSVKPLLYLDPSRTEASEIVLLHILKGLKRLMDSCHDRGQTWGKNQEEFRTLFKEMAGGLHLFVSSTDSLKELDAELFLDYGLDRAADSQRLRHLLHQTIALVCKAHNADALLLAIDDADTKFANAIEILECIRKYLDTPQLVVFVSGDMEMYSLLVQNHFQQDFAVNEKGFTPERKTQQTRMVSHLEEQYLLKLFPIQRRVQLNTLYTLNERTRKNNISSNLPAFSVLISGKNDPLPLVEAVDAIASEGLHLQDRHDLDLFREYVLKLPVRSVLQLLLSYYHSCGPNSEFASEAAASALRSTALSSLYRHDIDVESIAEGDLHAVINAAFDLCQLDGEPDTAIYLRPQTRDTTLRNAYVSLAAEVARLCEHNPAKAITYMVAMVGSNHIFHLTSASFSKKTETSGANHAGEENSLQLKVKQYLSVGRKDSALNWSLHATAALLAVKHTKGMQLRQGIIGVRVSRKKTNEITFDTQIRSVLNSANGVPYPAIAFTQSAVKRPNGTQRYLSIFNLLGLISNLLDLDASNADAIQRQLFKIIGVQTVSMPKWEQDTNTEVDDGDDDDDSAELGKITTLIANIETWLTASQTLKQGFKPSAVLMGKIWNRLYFSLDNISAAMRASSQDKRCSKAMELFALALINACLVEEVDYHYRKDQSTHRTIDRRNPRTDRSLVTKKFQTDANEESASRVDITPGIAPLTFMIATCPLVLGLLKNDKAMKPFITSLNNKLATAKIPLQIDESQLCAEDVWDAIGATTVSSI